MAVQTVRRRSVRKIASVGVLSAISVVLMYLEFSVPALIPPFIKLDFSDLPALLAAFGIGPVAGVAVELIKNLLHLPFTTTGCVGELANFLLGACFVLPAGLIYRFRKSKSGALIGALAGSVLMAVVSVPINYFLTYPVYTAFLPMPEILKMYQVINPAATTLLRALLMFNMPFTAVKGLISTLIAFLVYKKISPLLHGKS